MLQFGLPLLVLVGGFLFARRRARKNKKSDSGAVKETAKNRSGAATRQYRFKRVWRGFLLRLPPLIRRSILNFEHFVLLGAASSGKTNLVETYTDWRRQAKQLTGGESYDPDLQVYLTSGSVVMELPSRILEDHDEKCRKALGSFWGSTFRRRSPIVVVTIDAARLRDDTSDRLEELAGALRSKINLLSMVRRRPVEVRVALTHLDEVDGFEAFARFCETNRISTRLPVGASTSRISAELESWIEDARGHLPRALTTGAADEFRRVVAFLRAVPELFPTLTRFLELLFLHESLAPNPICDGVYLTSSPAGISNPFGRGKRIETGPDPRRNHLIAATAAASLVLAYFVLAYRAQWAQWSAAAHAWERYQPAQSDAEGERDAREAISEFGYRRRRLAQRFPDFFGRAAERTRNRLSERIREELLVPRLMQVALKGTTQEGSMPLPQRRSLYYLGLIHSDSADRLRILEPKRLAIWSSMTELEPDIISDYVKSTDAAHRRPVSLDFGLRELDPRDDTGPWRAIISGAQNAIEAGVIRPEELRNLQGRAGDLIEALERFDHDDVTKTILHQLDVGAGQGQGRQLQLRDAYSPKFDAFLRSIEASDFLAQREQLRLLLRSIRGTGIEETGAPLLRPLLDRLSLLYRGREAAPTEPAITVRLDGEQLVFDIDRWSILIRDSRASEQIGQFVRARAGERSIFFSEEMDAQLRPVVWNPANLGNSLFIGKGTIEGRYTRTAFEAHVGDAIARLSGLLSTAPLPEEDARALKEHVREHLLRYAAEYRAQLLRFYRSFSLHAQSQEALRVVLAQIVSEQSPLRDFLTAFERNTKLELSDPMLEPMREAVAEFAPLHTILDTENGAPEFSKYTAILGQMLADLGQPSEAMQAAFEPNLSNPGSLETALSASGRLELANLRNDGGSYRNLVTEWLDSVRLPEYQRSPFLAPFEQLANIGRRDIERSVSRVWERDMKPDWQRLSGKFPFDPDATDEAVPKDITGLLHPEAGKLFDLFRRYVEPISEIASGAPFRERRTLRGKLDLPSDMYPTLNTAAAVSARLWDSAGKAKPLELKFATVPFEHGPNPNSALTLVYLNAGDASVFNFNQKPGIITVRLDWTKEQTSQVGVQLTDLDSKENQFPQPTVVEGSFWSLLRLLKKAEALPVKQPANAVLYSWAIRHRRDGIEKTNARFVLLGDPWEALGQARSGPGRGPSSGAVD